MVGVVVGFGVGELVCTCCFVERPVLLLAVPGTVSSGFAGGALFEVDGWVGFGGWFVAESAAFGGFDGALGCLCGLLVLVVGLRLWGCHGRLVVFPDSPNCK